MLEIKKLNVALRKSIFSDAHVCFYDGNIHAVIGPSGSGKTTLLKCIIGEIKKNYEIYYYDEPVEDHVSFVRDHIFYVDQLGEYFHNMTIYQHFQFYADLYNKTLTKEEAEVFLQRVGLDHVQMNKYPDVFSIGERKRFLIALALYADKNIILLDEPTASLDKENMLKLKQLLTEIKNLQKMVIITTHDKNFLDVCDVIYRIEDCHLICEKNDLIKNEIIKNNTNTHFNFKTYIRYKNWIQNIQWLVLILMSLILCVETISIFDQNINILHTDPLVSNKMAQEMIYLRKRKGDAIFTYVPPGEKEFSVSLTEEELEKIKNIKGVKKVYPFDAFTTSTFCNGDDAQKIEIIKMDREKTSLEGYPINDPFIVPYYPENNLEDNESIYLSYEFARQMDIEEGDVIKGNFYIPTCQYMNDSGDGNDNRYVSYSLESMELEVKHILKEDEGISNSYTQFLIYMPIDQFLSIINENNGRINMNKSQMPFPIYTEGSAKEKAQPYTIDEYVVIVDKSEFKNVYTELLNMDPQYDIDNSYITYLDYLDYSQKIVADNNTLLLCIDGIGLITLVVIAYIQAKAREKEKILLKRNGISDKDILESIQFELLLYFIVNVAVSMIIFVFKEKMGTICSLNLTSIYALIFIISIIIVGTFYFINRIVSKKDDVQYD